MLFRTRYSQETLESFKSLVRDEKLLKKITGFIMRNKWIYFKPVPFNKISEKKIRAILGVKTTRIGKHGQGKSCLFSFQ